jgi:hypothetical protein
MSGGNLSPGEDDPNHPPSITIAPVSKASVGSPVTLTAMVTDDGLPKPRAVAAPRPGAQVNTSVAARPRGLNVTWIQYRGPTKVMLGSSDPIMVSNGQAVTTAHFTEPGTYVLRATANDGALSRSAEISIVVQ